MKRIGMLTSGGDCQALNAAMRGVVKGLSHNVDELEIYGFYNGYKGLIYGDYRLLTSKDFSGILTKGGTILGSSRQPFKLMRVPDENGLDKVEAMKQTYHKLKLDCPRPSTTISMEQILPLAFTVQSTWRVQPLIVYTQQQHPIIVSLS